MNDMAADLPTYSPHPQLSPEASEDLRRAWEYHKVADELLVQRTSWGIAAEAFLLTVFVAVFASTKGDSLPLRLIEFAICGIGLHVSWFLYQRTNSLHVRLEHMKRRYLEPIDPILDHTWRVAQIPTMQTHRSYQKAL
jgi:hypothetical protein